MLPTVYTCCWPLQRIFFQRSECSCRAVLTWKALQLKWSTFKQSEQRKLCSCADLNFWFTAVLYAWSLLGTKASDLSTNRKEMTRAFRLVGRKNNVVPLYSSLLWHTERDMDVKGGPLISYKDLSPWHFSVLTQLLHGELKNTESMWCKGAQMRTINIFSLCLTS